MFHKFSVIIFLIEIEDLIFCPHFSRTKVKREERAFSPVSSKASSESELILKAQEQYLTTILERTEVNTLETLERIRKAEAIAGPPPVHARVRVVGKAHVSDNSELESESEYSLAPTDIRDYYHDKLQVKILTLMKSDYIIINLFGIFL